MSYLAWSLPAPTIVHITGVSLKKKLLAIDTAEQFFKKVKKTLLSLSLGLVFPRLRDFSFLFSIDILTPCLYRPPVKFRSVHKTSFKNNSLD